MRITIDREHESANGWAFEATVIDARGELRSFTVRLSWVDYNHWSPDGADAPEAVARAALRFMLSREPADELAEIFDAARIRRRYADADAVIPTLIAR